MSINKGLVGYNRFLQGEKQALEDTVRAYSDALVRFARCYVKDYGVAEDVMEDTFVALILKRKTFKEEEQLRAYLYQTARNKALDFLRKSKRLSSLNDCAERFVQTHTEETYYRSAEVREVRLVMEKLPKQYQEVLLLHYFGGYTIEEMCELLKKESKQIYNLLSRAKLSFKQQLKKDGMDYEDL